MKSRISYLAVLSSGGQLYSGTGTALFNWIRFAKNTFDFALCIDNKEPLNYRIARDFCKSEGIRFIPSPPRAQAGTGDPGVDVAAHLAASGRWALIEFISWANAATNMDIIASRAPQTRLIYTPHTQPSWTIPDGEKFWALEPAFDRALAASDLVCCDSPAEVDAVQHRVPQAHATFIPIGIDTGRFCPNPAPRSPEILLVADFGEHRKRTDLSLAAITRLLRRRPEFRATLAGQRSQEVTVEPMLASRIRRLGYVSGTELVRLYQRCSVFLLLSDYEAFGIPIAEALACGTPVVTTATPAAVSLFAGLPGCFLVDNADEAAVDAALESAIAPGAAGLAAAVAVAQRFGLEVALGQKLEAISRLGGQAGGPLVAARALNAVS